MKQNDISIQLQGSKQQQLENTAIFLYAVFNMIQTASQAAEELGFDEDRQSEVFDSIDQMTILGKALTETIFLRALPGKPDNEKHDDKSRLKRVK